MGRLCFKIQRQSRRWLIGDRKLSIILGWSFATFVCHCISSSVASAFLCDSSLATFLDLAVINRFSFYIFRLRKRACFRRFLHWAGKLRVSSMLQALQPDRGDCIVSPADPAWQPVIAHFRLRSMLALSVFHRCNVLWCGGVCGRTPFWDCDINNRIISCRLGPSVSIFSYSLFQLFIPLET